MPGFIRKLPFLDRFLHKAIPVGFNHVPYNWTFADVTARALAGNYSTSDIGKFARQLSDNSIWMLTAITPTWIAVGSAAAGGGDALASLVNAEVSVTTTATLALNTSHVCSGTTADYTVTLPPVAGNTGKVVRVRMDPALTKLVTVQGNAAELIDGQNTRVMWAKESADLYCNGTNWTKIGGKSIPMNAKAYLNVDQSIATTTVVKILLDTASAGLNVAGIFVPASNKFIIRRPSTWDLSGGMQLKTGEANRAAILLIRKDVTGPAPYLSFAHMSSTTNLVMTGVARMSAIAGTVFDLAGYSQTSSPIIGLSETVTWMAGSEIIEW